MTTAKTEKLYRRKILQFKLKNFTQKRSLANKNKETTNKKNRKDRQEYKTQKLRKLFILDDKIDKRGNT